MGTGAGDGAGAGVGAGAGDGAGAGEGAGTVEGRGVGVDEGLGVVAEEGTVASDGVSFKVVSCMSLSFVVLLLVLSARRGERRCDCGPRYLSTLGGVTSSCPDTADLYEVGVLGLCSG